MASPQPDRTPAWVRGDAAVLRIGGALDADTTGSVWREAHVLAENLDAGAVVDLSELTYCDGSGAGLLISLEQHFPGLELRGARDEVRALLDLLRPRSAPPSVPAAREPFVARTGRAALQMADDCRQLVVFIGQLSTTLFRALRSPRQIRLADTIAVAEQAGIGALPIVALVGFLLGLILSFQSAIPMRRFGAEIFIADLLGLSMLRELGPLMAAILLTARSGSAFAAEIGTMKVNEELDALTTMGLEPVRFLVVPRVLAALLVIPVLSMVMNVFGLLGGAVVMLSLDFPFVTFVNRVVDSVAIGDVVGGLVKGLAFGLIVAGVGCLRGLQTGNSAGAVGESTTSAVVSGIILIAIADGLFAVLFYALDI